MKRFAIGMLLAAGTAAVFLFVGMTRTSEYRRLVETGDTIEIDIPGRTINLAVPDNELAARRETKGALPWKPAEHRTRAVSTALKAYALLASSANRGGVRILPGEE